ncbi:MAG: hypothetical protein HYZ15_16475 [Sphingobacteriales bacterium]|nr:hypothetical protein [Sphingobacteriales bacterium]
MKKILLFFLPITILIAACTKKKDDGASTGKQGPRAGSKWVYSFKEYETNQTPSIIDLELTARDTIIDGTDWLGISYKVAGSGSVPVNIYALKAKAGGWWIKSFTSGQSGLWLAYPVNIGQVYEMRNPVGQDYGFVSSPPLPVQVFSVTYTRDMNGVTYSGLIQAGYTKQFSGGNTLSEGINYRNDGALLFHHFLDQYTASTDNHHIVEWDLKSFTR